MLAGQFMTVGAATIGPEESIAKAARMMLDYRISGLPVVDEAGKLVGIVSEGDLVRRAETGTQSRPGWFDFLSGPGQAAQEYVRAHGRKVHEVMSREVVTVTAETPVQDVVELMDARGIKRVPVVRDGAVIGIISRANFLRSLARQADGGPPAIGTTDETIRARITSELQEQSWAPRASIDVMVRDGVVELHGAIIDERVRQAIIVAAENVRGVKQVKDNLVLIDPIAPWT